MPALLGVAAGAALVLIAVLVTYLGRLGRVRGPVLEEVRRSMRGGVIEHLRGRGPQARGRMGQLEVTVDLYRDTARPSQSPMWRVLAIGPVAIERPIEARVGRWQGWIDPWMQLGGTLSVPATVGPEFTVHSEHPTTLEHPVVMALRRQGPSLGAGALHARPDLMRAEVRFSTRLDDNRPLFAYLHAMSEISEIRPARHARGAATSSPRPRRLNIVPHETE